MVMSKETVMEKIEIRERIKLKILKLTFLGHLGTGLGISFAAAAGDDDNQNSQSASKPQDLNQSSSL